MKQVNVTRGGGFLENFLSKQRAKQADRLIPDNFRSGKILDIGCGSYPYFLIHTRFAERFGLDKVDLGKVCIEGNDITVKCYDIEKAGRLPFADSQFTVVTMLAVFEHIEPEKLVLILKEIKRILRDGGFLVLTTPAAWTEKLLRFLAILGLVSREEISEHKDIYSVGKIGGILKNAEYSSHKLRFGYFEFCANIWVTAEK